MKEKTKGILQILASGICFGLLGVLGKDAFAKGILPQELLGLRFLLGSLMLILIAKIVFRRKSLLLGSKKEYLLCLLLGVFGYALFSTFYFAAIKGLSISLAVLLLYTFPLWVTLLGIVFFKEKLTKRKLLAIPLCFFGLALLIAKEFSVQHGSAIVYGLSAALLYSLYIIVSDRHLKKADGLITVIYIQFFAGLSLCLYSFHEFHRLNEVISLAWFNILLLAFFCSALAMSFFQLGLQKLESWEASLLSTSEPLTAITLGVVVYQDAFSWQQRLGALLIVFVFILISFKKKKKHLKNA
jgi:drug/metabolite transporter, DME family